MPTRRRLLGSALAMPALHLALGSAPARAEAGLRVEHVRTIGGEGTGEGRFKYVEDFAFTRDGKLLVTDAVHAWVQVFEAGTGRFIDRFGGKGDEDQHLEKPEGIAVDPDGNIFVADYASGFVKVYGPDFQWQRTFSEYGSAPGQNQKAEFMSIHDGHLYMPEAGNHRVSVFDLSGRFRFLFGGLGREPGRMNNPEAAKFGPDGLLYLTDLRNDRVQVFDAAGRYVRHWGGSGSGAGEFRSPAGLAIDGAGRVYVTEIGNDRVQAFTSEGRFLGMWGRRGGGDGEFGNLHGIAVDPRTGHIFVADTANHRVQVFRAAFNGAAV